VDNSVDTFLPEAVAISATEQKPPWSFFVHKIKRTQNRQLQRIENGATKSRFPGYNNQPIVHKHLAPRE
jgi:hypothetical protein